MFKLLEKTEAAFSASGTFYNLPKGTFEQNIARLQKLQKRGDEHSKPLRGIIYTIEMSNIPAQFLYELDVFCALDRLGTNVLATEGFRAKKLISIDEFYAENKHNLWEKTTYNRIMQFSLQWVLRFFNRMLLVKDDTTMDAFRLFLYDLPFVKLFTDDLPPLCAHNKDIEHKEYNYESFRRLMGKMRLIISGMSPASAIDLLTYQSFHWIECSIGNDNLMSCIIGYNERSRENYFRQREKHPNREMRMICDSI